MSRFALAALLALAAQARADDAIPRPEHPEPMAARAHWANLNGRWEFRFDPEDVGIDRKWNEPGAAGFDRTIVVPFGWESPLSGVEPTKEPQMRGWYRRVFDVPAGFPKDQRIRLRFGAVDHDASVWINGRMVVHHAGGYTPFEADITDRLTPGKPNTLVVRAFDPTDPGLPTGKQVGWYTPCSGIWQTVWLEAHPVPHIAQFRSVARVNPGDLGVRYTVSARGLKPGAPHSLTIRTQGAATRLEFTPTAAEAEVDAGGPSWTEARVWTPEDPYLHDATLELEGPDGKDSVQTYFGLRTVSRGKLPGEDFERVLLNGKPIYLRGALDQSYNPKGVYTGPSDEFLKRDIELAKSLGMNFLRIHIKPEEPRRLYWADKLGMLIMEDMPCTWRQDARARGAWESTMREVVARDRNHPSIFAWVDFNETWGLGRPADYKRDKDTQGWVKSMVAETRKLDPTRLVEDNSPCNNDHVGGCTDLNSWHFYIDNYADARRHIEEVVAGSTPGSHYNHVPGESMNSAPLINSEYGGVGAGNGDRDVSWCFRDLTTQLRKQPKIQGYVYTELSDIEWEHNGFLNYDRSPKVFGYDNFVPGMTVADLQGADFVGVDGPPAIEAKVGEPISVPIFVSHYSDLDAPPTLRWAASGVNDRGDRVEIPGRDRAVEWAKYGVKNQRPIVLKINEPLVGAVSLVLTDKSGKKLAANYVNLVVRPEAPAPRVERAGDREVTVRFSPEEYARSSWSVGKPSDAPGKAFGRGSGTLEYRLKLPATVLKAGVKSVSLLAEVASKAGREKVEWAQRYSIEDYPQTDGKLHPSTLDIAVPGARLGRVELLDDPADARGVLSHLARRDPGSHGQIVRVSADLPENARAAMAGGGPLSISFNVADDAPHKGGVCLFGAEAGAYPFDPTLTITTDADLPADLGAAAGASIAVDTLASRRLYPLAAGDTPRGAPTTWAFATEDPGPSWLKPGFDDSPWTRGAGGFGGDNPPAIKIRTPWGGPRIWLRAAFDLPEPRPGDDWKLHLFHDEDVEIYVNGELLYAARGYLTSYVDIPLADAMRSTLKAGKNVVAVSCKDTGGGRGIDVGLTLTRGE